MGREYWRERRWVERVKRKSCCVCNGEGWSSGDVGMRPTRKVWLEAENFGYSIRASGRERLGAVDVSLGQDTQILLS